MVSIAAFQAVDPGLIPGRRSHNFGQIDLNYQQNDQACSDQDSNLAYCGYNSGSYPLADHGLDLKPNLNHSDHIDSNHWP